LFQKLKEWTPHLFSFKRYTFTYFSANNFIAAVNALWSFIAFMLFWSAFQSLIALKKKDEESTPLIFGTTKLN
jgi:hypothetical protein